MSAATEAKAERLLAEGAVHPIDDKPRGFTVTGDTDTYHVVIGRFIAWCDCKSGTVRGSCSHIEAARKYMEMGATHVE